MTGKMPASEFVARVREVAEDHKTLYVMGCVGAPMTGGNVTRYCNNHEYNRRPARTAMIQAAADKTPPVYGFDCVNLIKGILWGWTGLASEVYGGAIYPTTAAVLAGACPDIGADTMIRICPESSTDFSKIVPGAVVWIPGHIGVYIGDGLAVESSPAFENRVQITAVKNVGAKTGHNARSWTKWGKLPYIEYEYTEEEDYTVTKEEIKTALREVVAEELRPLIREVVAEVYNEVNPIYADLKDVPEYWRGVAAALLDAEAINGGTPAEVNKTDLNIRKETIKAAVVAMIYHESRERDEAVADPPSAEEESTAEE